MIVIHADNMRHHSATQEQHNCNECNTVWFNETDDKIKYTIYIKLQNLHLNCTKPHKHKHSNKYPLISRRV
jgi:hypothetical protein